MPLGGAPAFSQTRCGTSTRRTEPRVASARLHVAREEQLVLGRDHAEVDVRRPALVRHGRRPLEAEPPGPVRDDGRAPGAHVLAAAVRLPEMDPSAGERLQSTEERTTPVRTWPVPILLRRGGAPRPNGPEPSSSVGGQPGAAGADWRPPAARAARARTAADASSLTPVV